MPSTCFLGRAMEAPSAASRPVLGLVPAPRSSRCTWRPWPPGFQRAPPLAQQYGAKPVGFRQHIHRACLSEFGCSEFLLYLGATWYYLSATCNRHYVRLLSLALTCLVIADACFRLPSCPAITCACLNSLALACGRYAAPRCSTRWSVLCPRVLQCTERELGKLGVSICILEFNPVGSTTVDHDCWAGLRSAGDPRPSPEAVG